MTKLTHEVERRVLRLQNPWVAAIAILSLTVLQVYALQQKIDGALYLSVVAMIAGIAGYAVHKTKE